MLALFRCVAEAIAENGVSGLANMVPGGGFACAVAASAWKKYRERKKDAEIRGEIELLAQSSFEEARRAAVEAVKAALPHASVEDRIALELYLAQMPGAVRASLKRPDDGEGKTVPPGFAVKDSDDFARLLPDRTPRLRPGEPLVGKPGWALVELLGVGGFGEVWLARHRSMSALSGAVKFCHQSHARELLHESTLINRVMEVARGKPPNIVPLLDVHLDGEAPWLMYEYVAGGDLTEVIRAGPSVAKDVRIQQTIVALKQLSAAVAHFHQLSPSIVHRDLKPSNILVDKVSKKLLVTDFGIGAVAAKSALSEEARGGTTAAGRLASYMRGSHTPLYSSPQQRSGSDPDPRDDVHALGVITYQLLTGQLTQGAGADFAHDLRDIGVGDDLIELIGQCVAQSPMRRPLNAAELLQRISGLSSSQPRQPVVAPLGRQVVAGPPTPARAPGPLPDYVADHLKANSLEPRPQPQRSPAHSPLMFVVDDARLGSFASQAGSIPLKSFAFVRGNHAPTKDPEPDPLPEDISTSQTAAAVLGLVAAVGVVLTILGTQSRFFLFAGPIVTVSFALACWFVVSNSPYRRELNRRQRLFRSASQNLEAGERRWAEVSNEYQRRHQECGRQIAELVGRCRQLWTNFTEELRSLGSRAEELAREQYMRSQLILTSEIPNVGDKLKQVLASNGIVSAADINGAAISRVSGFGPDRTKNLLAWRDEVASLFRFNPTNGIPESQRKALATKYYDTQERSCRDIEQWLMELQVLESRARNSFTELTPELRELVAEWMRARANVQLIEAE
ncbi:MAG: protein kinase [Planctomycetes bacterium]|nr:protein kinase [Planctomycetota bacterium]